MKTPSRLIAFYLPQYHPIPENDEWWGEGFTEWRNVSRAKPLFSGHYQPHVPADLGYYDLLDEGTRVAQAQLAKEYGIEGFCYYHYWFNGRRLLERPLQEVLASGKPDFPFCVCWANENWTRRWDGEEQQVLMKQEYSEADDRAHIRSLFPVFEDKRYIRVDGKPFFLVYRTENMPDPARTAEIWREEARRAGIGELYLCRVESIGYRDPTEINFDAALEFAPDWMCNGPRLTADSASPGNPAETMGKVCEDNLVYSYQTLIDNMMGKEIPGYQWFRCVTPSWDNCARRKKDASIYVGSTPELYGDWLRGAVDITCARLSGDERIVFINAWNEWAEGNHLEPDQKHGLAYLEATRQALEESLLSGVTDNERTRELVIYRYQLNALEQRLLREEQKMEELLNSTSWRLTMPIRWVKRRLLDLKKYFSA